MEDSSGSYLHSYGYHKTPERESCGMMRYAFYASRLTVGRDRNSVRTHRVIYTLES